MDGGEGRGQRAKGEVCRDMREEVIVRVRGICWHRPLDRPTTLIGLALMLSLDQILWLVSSSIHIKILLRLALSLCLF
jgi:hypothetical protein